MTNTQHGQVPEALWLADLLRQQAAYHREVASDCDMRAEDTINWGHGEVCYRAAAELCRLHAYCQELEAHVILDCMTHGQKPTEIEHVAGDVSENGAESNMGGVYAKLPRAGAIGYASVVDIEQYLTRLTIDRHLPGVRDVALWTTDQMRAFADATHALRTQPQAGAITPPPIECNTEELKKAYAFGWWSALEKQRETVRAGAVPLTDGQIRAMLNKHPPEDVCGWSYRMGIDDAELHHGIKGCQHGTE